MHATVHHRDTEPWIGETNRRTPGLPTKCELKSLINNGDWALVGRLFSFAPLFLTPGVIDWRCVPKRVYEILQMPVGSSLTVPRLRARRKMLAERAAEKMCPRTRLYCRQNAQCHYCRQITLFAHWTVDHMTPLARGGGNPRDNTIGCCAACNHAKGCLSYAEFQSTDYMGGPLKLKDELRRVSKMFPGAIMPNPVIKA